MLQTPRPEVVLVISRWKTDGLNNTHTPATVENALLDTFKNTSRSIRIPEVTTTNCDTKNCQSTISYRFIVHFLIKFTNSKINYHF